MYVFVTDKTITKVSLSKYRIFTLPLRLRNCWRREAVERCADNTCLLTVDSREGGSASVLPPTFNCLYFVDKGRDK